MPSKEEQWKALPAKQTIPIDADAFKGLCKNSFAGFLLIIIILILVECKVYFTHEAVSVDSEIILQVALK